MLVKSMLVLVVRPFQLKAFAVSSVSPLASLAIVTDPSAFSTMLFVTELGFLRLMVLIVLMAHSYMMLMKPESNAVPAKRLMRSRAPDKALEPDE
jgi:hypothetical protein